VSTIDPDFNSLPPEYLNVLNLAQERYDFEVIPLRELKGGRTAARLYLVSVSFRADHRIEHFVLKIDRVHRKAKLDEIERHNLAGEHAPSGFARQHMAEVVYEVSQEGVIAIFYSLAGGSLHDFLPLAGYAQGSQLEAIFRGTDDVLLRKWNAAHTFKQAAQPQNLLDRWLGYRLKPGGNIERFLNDEFGIPPSVEGFLISGNIYPNPWVYARELDRLGEARAMDAMIGFQHGDLNIGNILVKFHEDKSLNLEGYYLIDFALFKRDMPLLYDQRYLEISYLLRELERAPFSKWVELVCRYAIHDMPNPQEVPVELAGASAVLNAGRLAFKQWVQEFYPSLSDDLWGQFWLAAVAAGMNYCNKAGLPERERLAGLIYAAAHLKRFCSRFGVRLPVDVRLLYDPSQEDDKSWVGQTGFEFVKPIHNLPVQPTSFVGREEQVREVRELLFREGVRLLTLTGPGGTGKTRLGLQVAQEVLEAFQGEVVFVGLADISDPELVIAEIAHQLGVREAGGQSLLENVKAYLRGRQTLLFLDNFEQVLDAAPLVADLLSGAPKLKVLVTSRTSLNIQGEHEYFVTPLKLPGPDWEGEIEEVESVMLFLQRAQAVSSRFRAVGEDLEVVAEICRQLDGLPLAIELAAARVKLISTHEMLSRLSDRLALLTGGARDLPPRQQTLRNTLDWSYDLLGEKEQTLFARLGVFLGGFSLPVAETVCNLEDEIDVVAGVEVLLDNSLVRQEEEAGDSTRFRMLETVREYALLRLQDRGELEALLKRHADYYLRVLGSVVYENKLWSIEGSRWLGWIVREYDNLRAVLSRSQHDPENFYRAVLLTWALFWFWYRRGNFYEGRRWLEWVLTTPLAQGSNQVRGYGLLFNGIMAMWQGDLSTGLTLIDESLTIWHLLEDDQGIAVGHLFKGFGLLNRGENETARDVLEQAFTLFQEADLSWQMADTLVHLSNAALALGDIDEARSILSEAETISRDVNDRWLIALVLNNYGEISRFQGEYARAGRYYREAESLLIEEGDRGGDRARLIHSLGYVALRKGDSAQAEGQFRESLAMFRRLGNKRGIVECIVGLAGLEAEKGEMERATVLLSVADIQMRKLEQTWWPADEVEIGDNLKVIKRELDAASFSRYWSEGQSMGLDEAIGYV
jgi:predicted ATPase/Tfp pilus assembly protein PilF